MADATQTPIEMSSMRGFSAIATALQGRYVVEVRPGHREPLNIYEASVAPPAARKSPVHRHMTQPLVAYEKNLRDETRAKRQSAIDDQNDWIGCLGGHAQARTPNNSQSSTMQCSPTSPHKAHSKQSSQTE